MGLCSQLALTMSLSLLSLLLPLLAVLAYLHLECTREREEKLRSKFHPEYHPEQTDCQGEIEFFNTETGLVSVTLGLEFTLFQWLPCSLVKLITLLGGRNMVAGFEDVSH